MGVLLSVKGLSRSYGGVSAINQVDVEIGQSEIVGLIGPNGAGKTTLFNVISGFESADSGCVKLADTDITYKQPWEIAREGLVRTFQSTRTFNNISVLDNLVMAQHLVETSNYREQLSKHYRFGIKEKALYTLEVFKLQDRAGDLAKVLPYGTQKILGIAMAVVTGAKILLLDEPVAGLNQAESISVMDAIKTVNKLGVSIWIIEHHMEFLMGLVERVIVLDAGKKIAEGTPAEITQDAHVISIYMGGTYARS